MHQISTKKRRNVYQNLEFFSYKSICAILPTYFLSTYLYSSTYLVLFGIEIYLVGSRFTDLYKKEPVIRISTDDEESSPCKYSIKKVGFYIRFISFMQILISFLVA